MKKFMALYEPCMLRPILNKALTWSTVALALLLVWFRFFNQNSDVLLVRDGCLIPALVFLAAAWFAYLKLDGMQLKLSSKSARSRVKKKRFNKGMMDYVETEVVPYEELSEEQRLACRFAANLLSGGLFLAASLAGLLVS